MVDVCDVQGWNVRIEWKLLTVVFIAESLSKRG
jgi:hypothetical protein